MQKRLHSIHSGIYHIALDIDTLDILPINSADGYTYDFKSEKIWWDESNFNSESNESGHIERITLCVSNDCNLRCKYCYAGGGNYGMQRTLMTKEDASRFIEFCCNHYTKIDKIMFFGGEPLLNHRIISFICDRFKEKADKRVFPLPIFTIITNGTISTPEVMNTIKEHISHVTVSIDGPMRINDANRVFPNGDGSYDKIAYFIKQCRQIPSLSIHYEATYNQGHINMGISKQEVRKHLNAAFGIHGIIADEDSWGHDSVLKELDSITRESLIQSDFDCLPIDFWQIVDIIALKKYHHFCGLYKDRFAVSSNGDILPCQMFLGSDNGIVSSIHNDNAGEEINSHMHDFKNNNMCQRCWCFKICGGCPIDKFYTKDKKFHHLPDSESCRHTKECIEKCLILLYMIYTDSELKPLFLRSLKATTRIF